MTVEKINDIREMYRNRAGNLLYLYPWFEEWLEEEFEDFLNEVEKMNNAVDGFNQAIDKKRVVVLPLCPGDIVWQLKYDDESLVCERHTIIDVRIAGHNHGLFFKIAHNQEFSQIEIGKTVFLTKQDAVNAMEEQTGKKMVSMDSLIREIEKYKQAEIDGYTVQLSARPGDSIWLLPYWSHVESDIREIIVNAINIYDGGRFEIETNEIVFTCDDIGDTLFFTKEEAMEALRERNPN